jgi:hypothetical protein
MKSARDVIVPDAAAGMRRLREATRYILTVPKTPKGMKKLRRSKK